MTWFKIVLSITALLFAQSNLPKIAVIPFSGDKTVSPEQLSFITSKFTGELISTKEFTVLDRGKMDYILKEQGFQSSGVCNSSECSVEMGQLLGVDHLVAGNLVRFGSEYALHLEFIDVAKGQILYTVDLEKRGDLEDVYKELCNSGAKKLIELVKKPVVEQGTLSDTKTAMIPDDAQVKPAVSKPLSTKRKIAIALWGTSAITAGGGYYFDMQGAQYAKDYDAALEAQDAMELQKSYDNLDQMNLNRNVSYGVSITSAIAGLVLWFLPEGK